MRAVQIALFVERARVLQLWHDDVMFVKERLNKDVTMGKIYTHRYFNAPEVAVYVEPVSTNTVETTNDSFA